MQTVANIHARSLVESAGLSAAQAGYVVSPTQVISILNKGNISFVLVGLHGISGWMNEPRGTEDVDVVVAQRHLKKAIALLQKAYTHLIVEEEEVVVRFRDPESDRIVIDLLKPRGLYRSTFKNAQTIRQGRQEYRIPSLEMALAMKFAAMLSPSRQEHDKFQDAHDFILLVRMNSKIDMKKLARLGELVFDGGGDELVEKVRKVRAGEKLIL